MRRSTVIAIQEEMRRVLAIMGRWDVQVQHCRLYIAAHPGIPAEDAQAVQELLDERQVWQDALNRRVLQLAGMDPGIGIQSTFVGSRDPRMTNL